MNQLSENKNAIKVGDEAGALVDQVEKETS